MAKFSISALALAFLGTAHAADPVGYEVMGTGGNEYCVDADGVDFDYSIFQMGDHSPDECKIFCEADRATRSVDVRAKYVGFSLFNTATSGPEVHFCVCLYTDGVGYLDAAFTPITGSTGGGYGKCGVVAAVANANSNWRGCFRYKNYVPEPICQYTKQAYGACLDGEGTTYAGSGNPLRYDYQYFPGSYNMESCAAHCENYISANTITQGYVGFELVYLAGSLNSCGLGIACADACRCLFTDFSGVVIGIGSGGECAISGSKADSGSGYQFNGCYAYNDYVPEQICALAPSQKPSRDPSESPSQTPSYSPSKSQIPSRQPTGNPSSEPSAEPSSDPSSEPSAEPSATPSKAPSANPSRSCENPDPEGCGWGIWNPWTCKCDCAVGICTDNDNYCYIPCGDQYTTNLFAGCQPGWDCPWHADRVNGYCVSEMGTSQTTQIYRTAKECCDKEFKSSGTCVTKSKDNAPPFPFPPQDWLNSPKGDGKPDYWYPDLYNHLNCVYSNKWESWMNGTTYKESYLFKSGRSCCARWYPEDSNCPLPEGTLTVASDSEMNPYYGETRGNYWYPDAELKSCGYGRDFPAWMGENGYAQNYLFTNPTTCCERFYKGSSVTCPAETTPQTGYYWEAYQKRLPNNVAGPYIAPHVTFYPDREAGTCVQGDDYPSWMNITGYTRLYLFDTAYGCCEFWFGGYENVTATQECVDSVVVRSKLSLNSTDYWYPDLYLQDCLNDGGWPSWMNGTGFRNDYLHTTLEECCHRWDYWDTENCNSTQVLTTTTTTVNPLMVGKWYPDPSQDYTVCEQCLVGACNALPWMVSPDFINDYMHSSKSDCCDLFAIANC